MAALSADVSVNNVSDVCFNSCQGCALSTFDFGRFMSNEKELCLFFCKTWSFI